MQLALATLVVDDYDRAIAWFTRALAFELRADEPRGEGKRWVVVGPREGGAGLLLARGVGEAQRARIGDQAGGRVAFFARSEDFWADYRRMQAAGVEFCEQPRAEAYGWVVVFRDCCGNRWDLLGPAGA